MRGGGGGEIGGMRGREGEIEGREGREREKEREIEGGTEEGRDTHTHLFEEEVVEGGSLLGLDADDDLVLLNKKESKVRKVR